MKLLKTLRLACSSPRVISRRFHAACFNERGEGRRGVDAVNSAARGRRTLERTLFSAYHRARTKGESRLLEGRQTMKSPVRGSFQSAVEYIRCSSRSHSSWERGYWRRRGKDWLCDEGGSEKSNGNKIVRWEGNDDENEGQTIPRERRLNLFTCISAEDTLWSPSALDEVEECALSPPPFSFLPRAGGNRNRKRNRYHIYDFRG